MEKDEIIADVEQTMLTLSWLMADIDSNNYNKVPFEGSWTAGQVVQHVIMVGEGFLKLLNGPFEETTRAIDEHVERIKSMFLNFNQKAVAGANVIPLVENYSINDQLVKLDEIKSAITTTVDELDLSMTCLGFDIRTFGYLTRLEAVYFFLFHTKKHVHQLQNIVKKLNNYQPL